MVWSKAVNKFIYALIPPAFWLGVWQLAAMVVDSRMNGKGNELLLPYPATVLNSLVALMGDSTFLLTVFSSLGRILLGLILGTAVGCLLAVLTFCSRWADRLFSPAIRVLRAAPVASFILLVVLWTGKNFVPVVIAALMVIPVVWGNLSRGIRETDPQLLELARAYRFSAWKTIRLIYLPCLRPYFAAAITTATGLAWKSGVAAEVLCLPTSAMGTQIFNTKYYVEIPQLFAWTAVVVTLSLLLEKLLRALLGRKGVE